jgi:periplasmic copper chaperone A
MLRILSSSTPVVGLCLSLSVFAGSVFAGSAFAADHAPAVKAGDVVVEQAWSRATPKSAANGAAFMTLRNAGAQADTLVSVESPASATVEMHATSMKDGVMQMRQVQRIDIPAGGAVELKPGGYHVMFIGLKAPLQAGQTVDLKLNFAKGGSVALQAPINAAGAPTPMSHSGH